MHRYVTWKTGMKLRLTVQGLRSTNRFEPYEYSILMVLFHLLRRSACCRVPIHLFDVEAPPHQIRWRHSDIVGHCLHVSCGT
jgi:hypothetical protein